MAVPANKDAAVTRDLWVAAGIAATGVALAAELWDYVPKARIFPLSLAITMIVCGVGVALSALRRRAMTSPPPARTTSIGIDAADPAAVRAGLLQGALPLALVLLAWALAVSLGAGYLLPSIPMLVAALWIAGARRPSVLILAGPAIALVVFTMFYIIFRTRLPELDAIRDLVAPLRRLF